MENKRLVFTVVLGLLLVIGVCLKRITTGQTTGTEALLLSVILAMCSMVASWVLSAYYAESSYDRNLRVFALKAAEKVTNLSNELVRLSGFLQQELETAEHENPKDELAAKDARIEAAIHIINTLKSVNDRSLSDWQGIIGDEITAQREVQEEREEHLRELLDKVENISSLAASNRDTFSDAHTIPLQGEIDALRKEVRVLAGQVSGVPIRAKSNYPRQMIDKACPSCSHTLQYRQRAKPGSTKGVRCVHCREQLYSTFEDNEFVLRPRKPVREAVSCPVCNGPQEVLVDPVVGSSKTVACPSCGGGFHVTRLSTGIRTKAAVPPLPQAAPRVISEELLQKVAQGMPPQPWPTGSARKLAQNLGLPFATVADAVQELIERGVFKMQVNGVLYERIDPVAREQ